MPSSWTQQYEDYWYVRFAVVESNRKAATHAQCMAATLALSKPQWRFKFSNRNATAPFDPCSDPVCDSDTLQLSESIQAKIKYQQIVADESEGTAD